MSFKFANPPNNNKNVVLTINNYLGSSRNEPGNVK